MSDQIHLIDDLEEKELTERESTIVYSSGPYESA
jgi:hypothetical protein